MNASAGWVSSLVLACAVVLPAGPAQAAGDASRGAVLFRQCAACHSTMAGEHMTGPSLADVWGRKAGTVEPFHRYSDAMKRADVVWNAATLDPWLADPQRFLPGTTMTFAGLRDPGERRDLVAYLEALSTGRPPAATTRGGGGAMAMQPSHPDLKSAPPHGQVKAIGHCGDTYAVTTADGETTRVWEFNLRFKTDSSPRGPLAGKPVIVGSGMQGDRASIVFAAPREMSEFVKESCD